MMVCIIRAAADTRSTLRPHEKSQIQVVVTIPERIAPTKRGGLQFRTELVDFLTRTVSRIYGPNVGVESMQGLRCGQAEMR